MMRGFVEGHLAQLEYTVVGCRAVADLLYLPLGRMVFEGISFPWCLASDDRTRLTVFDGRTLAMAYDDLVCAFLPDILPYDPHDRANHFQQ